jgi:hypothetical protein
MAKTREELEAALRELDQKELGDEALRLVARLHEIRMEAAKLVVAVNENPKADLAAAFQKAANLAEEAGQHGVRLSELRNA